MNDDGRSKLAALVRPAVRSLTAYHLDRHDVPVKLDQNENTHGLPPPVRAELVDRLREIPVHRYPTPGQPEIKRALAEANEWPREGILVGNGSDDLLLTVATAFLEAGRKAVVPSPSFFAYAYGARVSGADVIEVPMAASLDYDLAGLAAVIESHEPHVVYLCSPNNPTGAILSLEEIAGIAARSPGVVVLDEAYWEFAGWNGRELLDRHPNLLVFRTFSKALALAGARVGYLLAAPELAREIAKAQPPYPLNRFSAEAALVALRHRELLERHAREIAAERDRLFRELQALEGVRVHPSHTNFLLFGTRLGAKRTFDALLARGVLVRDVSKYRLLDDLLRVGIGTPVENAAFLDALKQTLNETETTS